MAGRQRLRLVQVRKPGSFDDLKTPAQILTAEDATTADQQEFIEHMLSQIRQILGTADWKDPPFASIADLVELRKYDVPLRGTKNSSNTVFTVPEIFLPTSFVLHVNGLRQQRGVGCDYLISESGGPGAGYDTVTLDTRLAPYTEESVTADYVPAT